MGQQFLSDTLSEFITRSGYSIGQVARQAHVPRRSLANWATGRAKRPRNVDDLLRIAQVIRLSAQEVDVLLDSAEMQTTLAQLVKTTATGDPLYPLLEPWLNAIKPPAPTTQTHPDNVPFQAIRDLPYFVGREQDIDTLCQQLLKPRSKMVVVQGMGGVGKSSLAARLAYQLRRQFPDGVLWARVDQSTTLAILHSFAAAFGRDVSQYGDIPTRSRVVREILADKRVLMILDDANDDADIEPLLPPTTQRCGVIITTRRIDLSSLLGAFWYQLKPFGEDATDSLNLFSEILGVGPILAQRETFQQLANLLGHLPLAIAITAGRLATDIMTSAENLLAQLQQKGARVSELTYGRDSLTASFDLSFEWLTDQERNFFTSLGIFSNDNIVIAAIAHVADVDQRTANAIMQKLYQLSLVQSSGVGQFKLHPLLHDYANARRQTGVGSRLRMVEFMVSHCEANTYDFPLIKASFSQMLKALAYAEQDSFDKLFMRGVHALAPYLKATGQFKLADDYLTRVQQLALLDNDSQNRARALATQGEILLKQGHVDQSGKVLGQALKLIQRLPESTLHADVYLFLGRQQIIVGEIESAEAFMLKGLETAREFKSHSVACQLMSRLSEVERNRGNYDRALEYADEGLALARALKSKRLISLLLNNRGISSIMMGDYEMGDACFRESLELAQAMGDREKCCGYMMNIATLSLARGKMAEAQAMHGQALQVAREIGQREIQASLLMNIGRVHRQLGQPAKAESYFEEALKIATVMQYASTKLNVSRHLGDLHASLGNFDKAERILSAGLLGARKLGFAATVTQMQVSLANLRLLQGQHGEAAAFANEGLTNAKERGMPVEACLAMTTLSKVTLAQDDHDACRVWLDEIESVVTTVDDAAIVSALSIARGNLALANGDAERAFAQFDSALKLAEAQSLNEVRAQALFGIAQALCERGDIEEAIDFGRNSLSLFEDAGYAAASQVRAWLHDTDRKQINSYAVRLSRPRTSL